MLNSQVNRKNIFLAAIFGILFGLAFNKFVPLATTNIFFLFAIPLIGIFFLLMVINAKFMLIILFFARALLDPLLNTTKLNIFGENIGIGGGINLFIIILAVSLIIRNRKVLSQNQFCKRWAFFLLISAIAISYSPVPGRAVKLFLNLLTYMSMAIIPFFIVNNVDDKRFWIKILILSSLLPVIFANVNLLKGGDFYADAGMRIKGTFTHPNILAFYLVLMVVLVFYALKSGLFSLNRTKRNVLRLYMIDLFILLLATKTRNAWVGGWGMFFIYGLLKEKKYLIFSVVAPFLLLLHPATAARVRNLFFGTEVEVGQKLNSFAWRVELWKSSLLWIKRKFIFGYGLASFNPLSSEFFIIDLWARKNVDSHNTYLELLFETGIVGLLSYIAIYLTALRIFFSRIRNTVSNVSREYALVFSYVISYMIVSFADNMLYYLAFNWYFWFFIGIMLKGIEFDDEKKDVCNNPVL